VTSWQTPTSHISSAGALSALNEEKLGKALGRLASGVYIITWSAPTGSESAPATAQGMLATWISQASFKPPMITAAANKERPILKHLVIGSQLAVNILGTANTDIFKAFAKPATGDEDRFSGLKVISAGQSSPPIFADAHAYLICRVAQLIDAGDHMLILAAVEDGELLNAEAQPMVHLRKNGFQY
jgi:flavin reductase (DIM6/NTAB) family NADH-FMN oxidoreductase RutF